MCRCRRGWRSAFWTRWPRMGRTSLSVLFTLRVMIVPPRVTTTLWPPSRRWQHHPLAWARAKRLHHGGTAVTGSCRWPVAPRSSLPRRSFGKSVRRAGLFRWLHSWPTVANGTALLRHSAGWNILPPGQSLKDYPPSAAIRAVPRRWADVSAWVGRPAAAYDLSDDQGRRATLFVIPAGTSIAVAGPPRHSQFQHRRPTDRRLASRRPGLRARGRRRLAALSELIGHLRAAAGVRSRYHQVESEDCAARRLPKCVANRCSVAAMAESTAS